MAKYITLNNLGVFLDQLKEKYKASSASYGGIKIKNDRAIALGSSLITGETTENRYYGVELDSVGMAFVNVPWEKIEIANATTPGIMRVKEKLGFEILDGEGVADQDKGSLNLILGAGLDLVQDKNNKNISKYCVKIGTGLATSQDDEKIYLVQASDTSLGGVKIGSADPISISNDGTLSLAVTGPIKTNGGSLGLAFDNNYFHLNSSGEFKFGKEDVAWNGATSKLDNFTTSGIYNISGTRSQNDADGMPIINGGKVEGRLTVLVNDNCVSQFLTLLNVGGGDSNIYTRTRQNGVWSSWGKLQTNIEVGGIGEGTGKTFDNLIDNGIYSGINVYKTGETGSNGYPIVGYETFVLLTVNGYATGSGVTQLKYSIMSSDQKVSILIRSGRFSSDTQTYVFGNWGSLKDKSTPMVPVNTVTTNTIETLELNQTAHVKFDSNSINKLQINNFATPQNGVVNNYSLIVEVPSNNFEIQYPTNKTIKWANGIKPFFTGGETMEIIFTTIDDGNTFNCTWTKYF